MTATGTPSHAPRTRRHLARAILSVLTAASVVAVGDVVSKAQTFSSGSDGSDLALTVPANSGTFAFNPADVARWGRVLDADGDGVYNFTTITIGANSTLVMNANTVARPIYWLASGDVTINGVLNLDGAAGAAAPDLATRRQVAVPGSGGFAGGAGGNSSVPATNGEGPGGGAGNFFACGGGIGCGGRGTNTSNRYLLPLLGGSGGGGAAYSAYYANGGGGGGAILVASSTTIVLAGSINARGGGTPNGFGGGGSGGSVRLVAPTLVHQSGTVDVSGGNANQVGGAGLIRFERFVQTGNVNIGPNTDVLTTGSPVDVATLRPSSQVRVTAVAGVAVTNPTASFVVPDVTINNGGPVPVDIAASGIPPGTVVTLTVYPQSPTTITDVYLPPVQATLSGTLAQSTATVNFTFPYGFSRGSLFATWTP